MERGSRHNHTRFLDLSPRLLQELNQLLVVQFTAAWCMPCKAIANSMNQLSRRESDVVFLKVDIDRGSAIATQLFVASVGKERVVVVMMTTIAMLLLTRLSCLARSSRRSSCL